MKKILRGLVSKQSKQPKPRLLESTVASQESKILSIYYPLDESRQDIRLLRVDLDKTHGFKCNLKTVSLRDSPNYIALSYCWTTAEPTCEILVNGCTFYVRPHLYAFLIHLRGCERKQSEWIFIDAICINQEDIDERSSQVRHMAQIYENAEETVLWLGSGGPRTDPRILSKLQQYFDSERAEVELSKDSFEENPRDEFYINLVIPFLKLEYWSRAWIVQEILLARKLTLQLDTFSLPQGLFVICLRRFIESIGHSLELLDAHGASIRGIANMRIKYMTGGSEIQAFQIAYFLLMQRHRRHQARYRISLIDAVTIFSYQECSEAYDKIFAVVGLTQCNLRPDYRMHKLELLVRVQVEGIIQMLVEDIGGNRDNELGPCHRLRTFHSALLSALSIPADNPTIIFITKNIYSVFGLAADSWAFYQDIIFQYWLTTNVTRDRPELSTHSEVNLCALACVRVKTLELEFQRLESTTLLPACDASGAKTVVMWVRQICEICVEVINKIFNFDLEVSEVTMFMERLHLFLGNAKSLNSANDSERVPGESLPLKSWVNRKNMDGNAAVQVEKPESASNQVENP